MIWIIWPLVVPGLIMAIDAALQGGAFIFSNAVPSLWIYFVYGMLFVFSSIHAIRHRSAASGNAPWGVFYAVALSALSVAGSFFNIFSPVLIVGVLTYGAIANLKHARLIGAVGYLTSMLVGGIRFYFYDATILGYRSAGLGGSGGWLVVSPTVFLLPVVFLAAWLVFEQTARIVGRGLRDWQQVDGHS